MGKLALHSWDSVDKPCKNSPNTSDTRMQEIGEREMFLNVNGIPSPTGQGWTAVQFVEDTVSMNSRFIEDAPTNGV